MSTATAAVAPLSFDTQDDYLPGLIPVGHRVLCSVRIPFIGYYRGGTVTATGEGWAEVLLDPGHADPARTVRLTRDLWEARGSFVLALLDDEGRTIGRGPLPPIPTR